ncbi:SPOR domain-containing protein [Microbulbifer sp. 2205BS26-8]|uniref:SPOR domain-containing protein n=1 Tax=Microbulbifer sp. 2205BS26-8 TaxID=3064386 RepID=UPI00273E6A48|nr:SPOR domain-containing protein [Microbulbifer sp. 2205BS26-8]MDP5209938.1 SPOR domain-containing protein [Microbulbifer sp. 2205BS26-8]
MENCEDKSSPRGRLNDGFKQRIVGALVLVALAVIFLPSLLDREAAKGYISEVSQIPSEPDIHPIEIAKPEPVVDVAPAPAPEAAFQPAVPEQFSNPPALAEQNTGSPPADKQAQDSPALSTNTSTVPSKGASPLADAQGLPMAWVVQVASYREATRAEQLRIRLMDKGYRAYTRTVQTDKGRLVRVFVGPKINKADAQVLKRKLDTLLQTQTLILRF